jgi:hypothetical protein
MATNQPTYDLSTLFGTALQALTAHRQEVNDLDGYNGNHGDNMVENVQLITKSLAKKRNQPPAEALKYASRRLQANGRGGTSQYYARGLSQAAEQLQGRTALDGADVVSLVQSLLGAIPSQGQQAQPQAGGSVLEQVLGLAGGQPAQPSGQQPQPQAGGSVLDQVLGLVGGQPTQPSAQPAQPGPQDSGVDLGDVLGMLLPAGLAFLQAKQGGADTASAAGQALTSALAGGRTNPLQSGNPRAAAGGLIAQSILKALMGGQ